MTVFGGNNVLAADVNALEADSSLKPVCRVVQSVAQTSIPHDTATPVTFTTEVAGTDIDTHNFHSTSSNTSRITPTVAGIYRFSGTVYFVNRTDWMLLLCYVRLNGSTQVPPAARVAVNGSSNFSTAIATGEVHLAMNGTTDYVELIMQARNTAASTFSTSAGGAFSSVLSCEFVRD
jgi:hypothetical protein